MNTIGPLFLSWKQEYTFELDSNKDQESRDVITCGYLMMIVNPYLCERDQESGKSNEDEDKDEQL